MPSAGFAGEDENIAQALAQIGIIGGRGDGLAQEISGLLVPAAEQIHAGDGIGRIRYAGLNAQAALRGLEDAIERGVAPKGTAIELEVAQFDDGETPDGGRIAGIRRDRPGEQIARLGDALEAVAREIVLGDEVIVVAVKRRRWLAPGDIEIFAADLHDELGGDRLGQLVLCLERLVAVQIVALGPNVVAVGDLDELRGHANDVADLADAARQDEADPKLAAELGNTDLRTIGRLLDVFGARASHDHEADDGGKLGHDILGEAVGESGLLGLAAEIGEAQHRNRGAARTHDRRFAPRPRLQVPGDGDDDRHHHEGGEGAEPAAAAHTYRGRRPDGLYRTVGVEDHPHDMNRAGDIFDLPVAQILEGEAQLVLHVIAHGARDANPAGLGQTLQPRGNVDAVAEDILAIDDDVAEIDADAEVDAAIGRQVGVTLGHRALDLDGAAHGIDDAGEFDE